VSDDIRALFLKQSPDTDIVASFFGTSGVANAMRARQFDVQEEIELLITAMRDPDIEVALRAQSAFRSTMKGIAETSGIIGKAKQITKKKNPDGTVTTVEAKTKGILAHLTRGNIASSDHSTEYAAISHLPQSPAEAGPQALPPSGPPGGAGPDQ
jgi:hypothetical protein